MRTACVQEPLFAFPRRLPFSGFMDDILALLRSNDRFILTSHLRPDGDALGSELALAGALRQWGKTADIINADEAPYNLDWMPGMEHVQQFDGALKQHEAIAEADLIVVLDTNDEERLGRLGSTLRKADAPVLLVDHHTEPEQWFDYMLVRDTASATGELVYELINGIDPTVINEEVATALYTAIMTDTGSFRYSSVTPHLHRIIADVLDRGGIDPAPIHEQIYDRRSMAGLRLLGRMLSRIRIKFNGQLAYSVVTQRMVDDTGASWDDKKGFVNYVLSIDGVKAAVLFSEVSDGAKISFRSEADTHVDEWARSFGGGGHRNASGAYVKGASFDDVIIDVIGAAPRFIDFDFEDQNPLSDEDASRIAELMKSPTR